MKAVQRLLQLVRARRGHLPEPTELSEWHRTVQHHRLHQLVRVPAEREHCGPSDVRRRRGHSAGQLHVVRVTSPQGQYKHGLMYGIGTMSCTRRSRRTGSLRARSRQLLCGIRLPGSPGSVECSGGREEAGKGYKARPSLGLLLRDHGERSVMPSWIWTKHGFPW